MIIKNWYFRSVFFVETVESSIDFYREKFGFSLNWKHEEGNQIYVCQLSRDGFELILAQDSLKAGKSRVFISLDSRQEKEIRKDIADKVIQASDCNWGIPIIKILDLDGNELFFSPP